MMRCFVLLQQWRSSCASALFWKKCDLGEKNKIHPVPGAVAVAATVCMGKTKGL